MNIVFRNANFYYQKEGNGSVLVLLHGFLHSSTMWADYKKRWLKDNYTVLTIDLPGHGKSGFFNHLTIVNMAEIVNAILEKENIEKATIIGHSLGGYTGLSFAEKFPNKVEKLILFHSSAFADTEEVKQKRDTWLKIIDRHPAMFVKNVVEFLYEKENIEKFHERISKDIENAKEIGFEGYKEVIKAMRDRLDTSKVLQSETNVFFIAGKLDKIIPEEISQKQIRMIKNGSGVILEKASHMSFVEDAESAFEQINVFLKEE